MIMNLIKNNNNNFMGNFPYFWVIGRGLAL